MKKLSIVTATRAEYFLLAPIIKKLKMVEGLDVRVCATGAHLSPEFGMTYRNIEVDGIEIDKKIEILLSADTPSAISKTMGTAMISFADYFAELMPDALLLLGDRYELLAVACAAMNQRIPIIHLYGGETTEGAVDEAVRHCLTKMSALHFTANDKYAHRVIQMGENSENVKIVGAMGPENAIHMEKLSREELSKALGVDLSGKYAVVTFHPVTLENNTAEAQANTLCEVFEKYSDITFICTKANADSDGRIINRILGECCKKYDNAFLFDSLGSKKYLSAVEYSEFVLGNSSSGLSEVPSLGVPTVNIGDRQKGRMRGPSVIDCDPTFESICEAIDKALSPVYKAVAAQRENPYGNGNTSGKIAEIVTGYLLNDKLKVQKKFIDIDF